MAATKHAMTKQMYNQMKPYLRKPSDDFLVMKRFGYSKTVVKMVRNTKDWHEYEQRLHRFGGYPRKNQSATPRQNVTLEFGGFKQEIPTSKAAEILSAVLESKTQQIIWLNGHCSELNKELTQVKDIYHKRRATEIMAFVAAFAWGVALTILILKLIGVWQ